MTEEFNAIGQESRLFRGCCDAMVSKCLENEVNMLFMLLYQVQEDGDVVLIYCTEFADIFTENVVHISLEGCRSIAESLWHDKPFIQSERCFKCCFVYVLRVH